MGSSRSTHFPHACMHTHAHTQHPLPALPHAHPVSLVATMAALARALAHGTTCEHCGLVGGMTSCTVGGDAPARCYQRECLLREPEASCLHRAHVRPRMVHNTHADALIRERLFSGLDRMTQVAKLRGETIAVFVADDRSAAAGGSGGSWAHPQYLSLCCAPRVHIDSLYDALVTAKDIVPIKHCGAVALCLDAMQTRAKELPASAATMCARLPAVTDARFIGLLVLGPGSREDGEVLPLVAKEQLMATLLPRCDQFASASSVDAEEEGKTGDDDHQEYLSTATIAKYVIALARHVLFQRVPQAAVDGAMAQKAHLRASWKADLARRQGRLEAAESAFRRELANIVVPSRSSARAVPRNLKRKRVTALPGTMSPHSV